jgi:hypothetical protein
VNRTRFLLVAAAAGVAAAAPGRLFAETDRVATVTRSRAPRQMMYGAPGRCAGARRSFAVAGPSRARGLGSR